jgi:hypothetical protein
MQSSKPGGIFCQSIAEANRISETQFPQFPGVEIAAGIDIIPAQQHQ